MNWLDIVLWVLGIWVAAAVGVAAAWARWRQHQRALDEQECSRTAPQQPRA